MRALSIANSGLTAASAALEVTARNVANLGTDAAPTRANAYDLASGGLRVTISPEARAERTRRTCSPRRALGTHLPRARARSRPRVLGNHFVGVTDAAPARNAASSAFFTCQTATS